jgi:ubiquinone/menaquinone biosynthesis C-methylase UbiE
MAMAPKIEMALKVLGDRDYSDYLDCGCGKGWITGAISSRLGIRNSFGVDISDKEIKEARSKKMPVRFEVGDVHSLGFRDSSFDLVTSFEVIEHLDCPLTFLKEVYRVLRPGGVFLITTPNAYYYLYMLRMLFRRMPRITKDEHYYLWDVFSLYRLLNRVGFRYSGSYYSEVSLPFQKKYRRNAFLSRLLGRFCMSMALKVEKPKGVA